MIEQLMFSDEFEAELEKAVKRDCAVYRIYDHIVASDLGSTGSFVEDAALAESLYASRRQFLINVDGLASGSKSSPKCRVCGSVYCDGAVSNLPVNLTVISISQPGK